MTRPTGLLAHAEVVRLTAVAQLARRAEFGQFFTPEPVARLMASLLEVNTAPSRLLDPGAGSGVLTAAVVDRWRAGGGGALDVTMVEAEPLLRSPLTVILAALRAASVTARHIPADFLTWAEDRCSDELLSQPAETFDLVIVNPPYRKVNTDSAERAVLSRQGVEVSNLYAAFVALAVRLLRPGGQLVAITPRSWANGPYFRSFRTDLLDHAALTHVHVYETRNTAFADAAVLQENVIFRVVRGAAQGPVVLSTSHSPADDSAVSRTVPYGEVVHDDDLDRFVHLTLSDKGAAVTARVKGLPCTLGNLGLTVSTGRVVDFRAREHLRADPGPGTVPLIYPMHLREGRVLWPRPGAKKPSALAANSQTAALLLPNGHYPIVKRFSAKEERRRVVAALSSPDDVPGGSVAFENHTNVFHARNTGLDPLIAAGLVVWLNSTVVDDYFRLFSGHTQVNATDLRKLRYPDAVTLKTLGNAGGNLRLTQAETDALVDEALR